MNCSLPSWLPSSRQGLRGQTYRVKKRYSTSQVQRALGKNDGQRQGDVQHVLSKVNAHCSKRRNKWRVMFMNNYLSSLWVFISLPPSCRLFKYDFIPELWINTLDLINFRTRTQSSGRKMKYNFRSPSGRKHKILSTKWTKYNFRSLGGRTKTIFAQWIDEIY